MGLFATRAARARRKVRDEHGGSFLALARSARLRRGRSRPSSRAGRPGATSRPTTAARSRSSSAPRSPPPTSRSPGLAPGRRPRPADAVRRQPRPARAAARRRARASTTTSSPASTREELLEHDSPEEVEIRACALHAVELLVAAHPAPRPRPRSTTRSGTAAPRRATRRAPATAPARPPTEASGRVLEGQRHRLHLLGLDQEDDAGAHRERRARVLDRQPVDDLQRRLALDGPDDAAADLGHPVGLLVVGDRERHARVALEVAGLARGRLGEEHDVLALDAGPDRDGVRRAAREHRRQVGVVGALEEGADVVGERGHAAIVPAPPSSVQSGLNARRVPADHPTGGCRPRTLRTPAPAPRRASATAGAAPPRRPPPSC